MANYQPFLISEFKTGLYDYLQPWIRPQDAFEPLVNAFIYRGVLQKRNGSTIFGNQLGDAKPVMGIMQYQNESTGAIALFVASTQNAYLYSAGATPDGGTFGQLTSVGGNNSIFWQGTATGTITMPTFWPNFANGPGTIFITDGTTTVSFGAASGGVGTMTGAGGIFSSGSIVYATGVVTLTFSGSTAGVSLSISGTLVGPYFTGNITNFFNWVNWQPTSSVTAISTSYLYMTNDKDPITIFDGTNLARPIFYVDSAFTTYINSALDVKVYNNRLLILRPTISGEANQANQDVYFSALFNPFDFVGDITGHGGAISAATGDQIISAEFIRDNLTIAFSNSTWSFQISGVNSPPFIFRRLNSSKNTACPYAGVQYDERVTNLGNTGFLACDGVNVQRFDISVIDYYETQIDQQYFNQDFSQRYDNLNQTWMFYPSYENENPLVGSVAPGSDETLIYNFLENTWATYENSFPMTCLGKFLVPSGTTWAEAESSWEDTQVPWNYSQLQSTTPFLLGGDTTGNVYHLDNGEAVRDGMSISGGELQGGTSFNVTILTTRWNPFLPQGQKTQFGYIDVYYSVSSVDPANPIQVTFNFYVGNSNVVAAARTLTFDGPAASNNEIIDTGNGGSSYSGTFLTSGYVIPGTVQITVLTSNGHEIFDDNESGILEGTLGDTGTINYNTGAWTLSFVNGNTVPSGNKIVAAFNFYDSDAYNFKRIYCNLTGEFIRIGIDPSEDAPFQINGFVLWARPAGRLTP